MTDTGAFPSNAAPARKAPAKPFGSRRAQQLMDKERALRTMSRQEAFDRGYLTVKDLDDEELRYGRCRDASGQIPYRNSAKTLLIPQRQYDAMVAEHELRFKQKLRQNLDDMLEIMVDIAKDDAVEPRERFEAAKYIFERTAGKTPDKVDITVKQAPWEEVLADVTGIGTFTRDEHRRMKQDGIGAGVIDVEYTEEQDSDEDDLPPEGVPVDGEYFDEPDVVLLHQPGPAEPGAGEAESVPAFAPSEQGYRRKHVPQPKPSQPTAPLDPDEAFKADPVEDGVPDWATVQVDEPDPMEQYGSRRTEERTYAQQTRDAQALAERRRAHRKRIQDAKKDRKIRRATGADAIVDEITGATLGDDGKLTFD